MERNNYNIKAKPQCVFTITYGPMNRNGGVPFLGNNIYDREYSSIQKPPPDNCETRNTILDTNNMPKFTLPLSEYKYLKQFDNKIGPIFNSSKGLYD
jgi:hypothetical protein